ncbi:MAG: hypothetical protein JW969_14245 [Spirochaetales bacterium]|nr:hypothetical protein [Spirochaetales bacterium]
MTVIYCDVTKKPIESATTNYTWETRNQRYDTLKNKDLSPEGMSKLQKEVTGEMETKSIFSFGEYKRVLEEKLAKVTR